MKTKINFYKSELKLTNNFIYFDSVKDIKKILKYISKERSQNMSMSVYICDSKRIRELNKKHRSIDSSTDVLSFPHNELEEEFLYIGDIFINEDILLSQSKEINSNPQTEFKFLVMHGILHLVGYDHQKNEDEKIMIDKQKEIFNVLNIRK